MPHQFCYPLRLEPQTETKYIASRTAGKSVIVQTQAGREPLKPRLDLIRHSPAGFDWAHTGLGAAQLAFALLAHASGSDEFALEHYQVFKHEIVARLPKHGWNITSQEVLQMLRFVSQGMHSEVTAAPQKIEKVRKTATIQTLPSEEHTARITAHGSASNVGDAISRAVRNLLRDKRLRQCPITNLQMQLSVINVGSDNLLRR